MVKGRKKQSREVSKPQVDRSQSRLRYLYTRKEELELVVVQSEKELRKAEIAKSNAQITLRKTRKEIDNLETKMIFITDHALERFKERFWDISRSDLGDILITPEMEAMIGTLGSGKYPVKELDAQIVVVDRKVITVLGKDEKYEDK